VTNASSSPPSGSLPSRAIVTVVAVAGFAALCQADVSSGLGAGPGWWLAPVAAFLGWAGAVEAARMAAARSGAAADPLVPFATAALPLVAVAAAAGGPMAAIGQVAVAAVAAVGLLLAIEIARYRPGGQGLSRLAGGVFTLVAIGLPLAFMVGLRLVGAGAGGIAGLVPLVSMVAVVKGGDIAAYLVGSALGRHKMAPALSPGKTWEGAAASLAASLSLAWLLLERLPAAGIGASAGLPWGGWPVYGLAVGVAGMLGDLAESLVKRELDTKDSGRFLGGLGGILDLIDAPLFAAPVAWLLWVGGGGR
jgi:phosphatidate cytidylyltransferase